MHFNPTHLCHLSAQLSSTAKVAAWFQQLNATAGASLSRPESGFVSGDSRSERNPADDAAKQLHHLRRGTTPTNSGRAASSNRDSAAAAPVGRASLTAGLKLQTATTTEPEDDECDEYLLVEGSANLWSKLSAKKRRKLLSLRLGRVTTF